MAISSSLLLFTFFSLPFSALLLPSSYLVNAIGNETTMEQFIRRSQCQATVAACAGEDEFGMESEISRRILQVNSKYISYDSLKRGAVPCSQRGASYYNCKPGAEANPYARGCSAITRCRH